MNEDRMVTKVECKYYAFDDINTILEAFDEVGRKSLDMTRYDEILEIPIYNDERLENIVSKLKKCNEIYLGMLNEIRLELLKVAEDIDSGKEAFCTNYCGDFAWPEPIDVNDLDVAYMKTSNNDATNYDK